MREMNRKGVLCDVSHLNEAGFWDVIEHSTLPPVASHSNARALCEHTRNLTEAQIRAVIEKKGYIGVNFYSAFLANGRAATLEDVYRHVDAILQLGGEDVVGFGSDFDGIDAWPEGLANPADFPALLNFLPRAAATRPRCWRRSRAETCSACSKPPKPRARRKPWTRGFGTFCPACVPRAKPALAKICWARMRTVRSRWAVFAGRPAILICWWWYLRRQRWRAKWPLSGRFGSGGGLPAQRAGNERGTGGGLRASRPSRAV